MRIGRIFKIVNRYNNEIFIGSTFDTLYNRWQLIKHDYPDGKMLLIEEVEVENRDELNKKALEYFDNHKNQTNILFLFKKKRTIKK